MKLQELKAELKQLLPPLKESDLTNSSRELAASYYPHIIKALKIHPGEFNMGAYCGIVRIIHLLFNAQLENVFMSFDNEVVKTTLAGLDKRLVTIESDYPNLAAEGLKNKFGAGVKFAFAFAEELFKKHCGTDDVVEEEDADFNDPSLLVTGDPVIMKELQHDSSISQLIDAELEKVAHEPTQIPVQKNETQQNKSSLNDVLFKLLSLSGVETITIDKVTPGLGDVPCVVVNLKRVTSLHEVQQVITCLKGAAFASLDKTVNLENCALVSSSEHDKLGIYIPLQ